MGGRDDVVGLSGWSHSGHSNASVSSAASAQRTHAHEKPYLPVLTPAGRAHGRPAGAHACHRAVPPEGGLSRRPALGSVACAGTPTTPCALPWWVGARSGDNHRCPVAVHAPRCARACACERACVCARMCVCVSVCVCARMCE